MRFAFSGGLANCNTLMVMMTMKSRFVKCLLMGVALCLWGAASVSAQVTEAVERPDTTDFEAFLDFYKGRPDSNEKYEAYLWALRHIDSCNPADWQNRVRILCNLGNMFCGIKDFVRAKECMDEALGIVDSHLKENSIEVMWYAAMVRINRNQLQYGDGVDGGLLCEDVEMGIYFYEQFCRMAEAEPEGSEWREELEGKDKMIYMSAASLASTYKRANEYERCIRASSRALDAWGNLSNDTKNETLYFNGMLNMLIIQSAVKTGDGAELNNAMERMEMFLVDVRTKLDGGTVSVDDETAKILSVFSGVLIEGYSAKHNLGRCEEAAALAVTFHEKSRGPVNYELCKAYIQNDRADDARKLYAELLKDEEFVREYDLSNSDTVGVMLSMLDNPETEGVRGDDGVQRLRENISLSRQALSGGSSGIVPLTPKRSVMNPRVTITGYRYEEMNPRPFRDGGGNIRLHGNPRAVGVGVSIRLN